MSIFNLPDLGEGLPDAEINEWHVKVGDTVKTDQPLVSMETAKAVVEVPSPQDGVITKLYGESGDVIITGSPLVAFESAEDSQTVVGNIEASGETVNDDFTIGSANKSRPKATPRVKQYAKKCGVDLAAVTGTGAGGVITMDDVKNHAFPLKEGFTPLKGVRKSMVQSMTESHQHVVPVTIFDDADIHAWNDKEDITARLIKAICVAAHEEPALNAHYDGFNMAVKQFKEVHLGLAMDAKDGLFVPVIDNAQDLSPEALRVKINEYKVTVNDRTIDPKNLMGSTITLSNFGKFAGRYASPIIVPPSVAILGVGRLRTEMTKDGEHKVIPLSLSFDHRAVTGGEATRFLGAVIASLESA